MAAERPAQQDTYLRTFRMKQVHITTRGEWRQWLAENHDREAKGIWLVFNKKKTGKASLEYGEAVEEALCFGWIDSIIKRIDDETYCRKFTPRRDKSGWSTVNRKRVAKVIEEGRMTEVGLAKIAAAKQSGHWEPVPRPVISFEMPEELAEALARNQAAKAFFESLAPTYQKHFIGWIVTAKRPETKARRLQESLALLADGKKLGLR
jgi:uncharacterized protein YdeI (YjbR/CyaY-like superfamily)